MDKNGEFPPSRKKGSGAGCSVSSVEWSGPARGVQDLPSDVLSGILRRVSKAQGLGSPLHFALVCRRFADVRFRAAVLRTRRRANIPGPLLANELKVYQGPTSLKLDSHSVLGLRALWRTFAVQGPVLTALNVHVQGDTCVECEGECPNFHEHRDSQLCAHSGQASAWWAFSGPFLRAQPGLRSLSIQGDHHRQRQNQGTCLRCCVGFTGSDSLVSLPELRSSLPRLKHLSLEDVNLGWPQDWPSALPSLKSLDLIHYDCESHIGQQDAACIFPWSILQMIGLTSLSLTVDTLSICNQDFHRLSKLRSLSLTLFLLHPYPEGLEPPASLWTLTGLRSLTLKHMGSIPESGLGRLVGLTQLVLSGVGAAEYRLGSLPHSLQALESVKVDTIAGFEGLGERVGRRDALTILSFRQMHFVRTLAADFCELACLRYLYMNDLEILEVLPENFGTLKSLQELILMHCPSLRRLPADFGLLASLAELRLHSLDSLELLPEGFGRLQSLRILAIESCEMLRRLPADFGQLSSLKDLKLEYLEALEELPEMSTSLGKLELAGLTGVRSSRVPGLVIHNTQEDMSLPTEDLPGLGGFARLEGLSIKNCGSLVILPEFLQRLSSLKGLVLVNATGPGGIAGDFLREIPSVHIEGHAERREGGGLSEDGAVETDEDGAEDLGEEGEDGE